MKKIILFSIFLLIMLSVVITGFTAAKTTITYWSHTHPPMIELNKKLIAEYMEKNPDVEVNYEIIPNDQYYQKILVSIATGVGPDVYGLRHDRIPRYVQKNALSPIDLEAVGYASILALKNDYLPGTFEGLSLNGKIYGLPSEYNVGSLFINTAHFREADLDPSNPLQTWKEVIECAKKLTKYEDGKVVRRGFDLPYLHAGWYLQRFDILLEQNGGSILNQTGSKSVINDQNGLKTLQFWYDLVYKYQVASPRLSPRDTTNPNQDFLSGDVSMWIGEPWLIGQITEDSPVYNNYKVLPLPQFNLDHRATRVYSWSWGVSKKSEHKKEAWKFIKFLAAHPQRYLDEVGFVQPKKGAYEGKLDFPYLDVFLSDMEFGSYGFVHTKVQELSELIKNMVERSVMNGMEPQKSLDIVKEEIDKILSD